MLDVLDDLDLKLNGSRINLHTKRLEQTHEMNRMEKNERATTTTRKKAVVDNQSLDIFIFAIVAHSLWLSLSHRAHIIYKTVMHFFDHGNCNKWIETYEKPCKNIEIEFAHRKNPHCDDDDVDEDEV